MIVSDLSNIDKQLSLTPGLRAAIAYLRSTDISQLPDGKVEIEDDRVFALIQRYETNKEPSPKFEFHRKYIDVQFIASGEEAIGWASLDQVEVTTEYDGERDAGFGDVRSGRWTPIFLRKGQLAVLFPEDAHAPKLAADLPHRVTKAVVKVAV